MPHLNTSLVCIDAEGRRAFTIIELLIAMSITLMMLFLIDRIFFDTATAVSQSAALSDIIAGARTVGEQLEEDSAAMVGPHEGTEGLGPEETGGILMILQREIQNAPYITKDGSESTRDVRSDQLVFIRNRRPPGEEYVGRKRPSFPICPEGEDNFTSVDIGEMAAPFMRVWYGHVRRTEPDGTDTTVGEMTPGNADDPTQPGALGQTGPNRLANQWILGRQALFLGVDGSNLPSIHVNAGWYNNVGGTGTGTGTMTYASSPPASGLKHLFMGLTDFAYYGLDDPDPTSTHSHGSIVGGIKTEFDAAASAASETAKSPLFRLWSSLSVADYHERAYYYSYGFKRLRVNPIPNGNTFESWQIAQAHPYLVANVSDFIVEFAGDYRPGTAVNPPATSDGDLDADTIYFRTKWYTAPAFANVPLGAPPNPPDADRPHTWDPESSGTVTFNPYDDDPELPSNVDLPHADYAFVWRHDEDDESNDNSWPYLIRVRYRLHDTRGQFQEWVGQYDHHSVPVQDKLVGKGESGMWFEHIIHVNRPDAN